MSGWLQLSRCDGAGSDRFLARSLADALSGGARLTRVARGAGGDHVDFVLARNGGASCEVIRAVVDASGRPSAVEMWLVEQRAPERRYWPAAQLANQLADAAIVGIRARDGGGVELRLSSAAVLALGDDDFR